MSESFLDYRRRVGKIDRYHAWLEEREKTFYRPQSHEDKVRQPHWEEEAVDTAFRINIRRYDLPSLTDED